MEEKEIKIENWWMPHQIDLVKDHSIEWKFKLFKTSSGTSVSTGGGRLVSKTKPGDEIPTEATIIEGAWDHEHCQLCFETISDQGEFQRGGYTDENSWLCSACYATYILPNK